MKLNKWLITLPIVASAAPIVATATSCSSIKGIILEGDCAKYCEIISPSKYTKGERCDVIIKVKDEYVNQYFLPGYISHITCGDEIVWHLLEAEEDIWFIYQVNDSHTEAKISITEVPGKIKLDFSLLAPESIDVEFLDPFETKAFFEEGQKFSTDSMLVKLILDDESEIYIDSSAYSVQSYYPETPTVGQEYDFTITYSHNEQLSVTKKAKCVAKNSKIKFNNERYTNISDAITAYNNITESHLSNIYLLRIGNGKYTLDNEIEIKQNLRNKKLIITGVDVSLSRNITGSVESNLFTITNTDNVENTSVTFSNLTFDKPTVSGGSLSANHNFINANNANGVILSNCTLNGIEGEASKYINAIKATTAKNISITYCDSNFINTYITGTVSHYETEKENYDIYINDCEAKNQISLEQITGHTIFNFIGNTSAELFYTKDETTKSDAVSAIGLNGDGKILISGCNLTQLRQPKNDEVKASYVKVWGSDKDANKTIVVRSSQFNHLDESTTFKDFYNYSQYKWTVERILTEPKEVGAGESINFYE